MPAGFTRANLLYPQWLLRHTSISPAMMSLRAGSSWHISHPSVRCSRLMNGDRIVWILSPHPSLSRSMQSTYSLLIFANCSRWRGWREATNRGYINLIVAFLLPMSQFLAGCGQGRGDTYRACSKTSRETMSFPLRIAAAGLARAISIGESGAIGLGAKMITPARSSSRRSITVGNACGVSAEFIARYD
jgi:hypothetical protein